MSAVLRRDLRRAAEARGAGFDTSASLDRLLAAIACDGGPGGGGAPDAGGTASGSEAAAASNTAATSAPAAINGGDALARGVEVAAGAGATAASPVAAGVPAQACGAAGVGGSVAAASSGGGALAASGASKVVAADSGIAVKSLAIIFGKGAYWGLGAVGIAGAMIAWIAAGASSWAPGHREPTADAARAASAVESSAGASLASVAAETGAPSAGAVAGRPTSISPSPRAEHDAPCVSCKLDPPLAPSAALFQATPRPLASAQPVRPRIEPGPAMREKAASEPAATVSSDSPAPGAGELGAPRESPAPGTNGAGAAASSTIAEEVRALAQLRARAGSDPNGAVALADAAAQKFPNGVLAEEREAIAISALARAGRTDEARARALRFLALRPASPFAVVVQRSVGVP